MDVGHHIPKSIFLGGGGGHLCLLLQIFYQSVFPQVFIEALISAIFKTLLLVTLHIQQSKTANVLHCVSIHVNAW